MYYYKFNISDWHLATSHLSLEEEAVYFKLINYYYDSEQPIPVETDSVIRRLRLDNHKETVAQILSEFFVLQKNGYNHIRCNEELKKYKNRKDTNKKVGKLGGRPPKTKDIGDVEEVNPQITQTVSYENPQITLTTNHKPITNNHTIGVAKATKGTRWQKGFVLSDEWINFCKKNRSDLDPKKVFEEFTDYWVSVAGAKGVKLDWSATWRNWVRNQKSGAPQTTKKAWE